MGGFHTVEIIETFSKLPRKESKKPVSLFFLGDYLLRIGTQKSDIANLLINYPRLIQSYKHNYLKQKLGYLLKVMHVPFSMLLTNPVVLSYSLERISSRL